MTEASERLTRKKAPAGASLAFLALFLQVLLPFFVAFEITALSAAADDAVICSASGSHGAAQHENGSDQTDHGACSLCIALAAAHAFTGATPVALPLPQPRESVQFSVAVTQSATTVAVASYNPRAPPFIS